MGGETTWTPPYFLTYSMLGPVPSMRGLFISTLAFRLVSFAFAFWKPALAQILFLAGL
jgi:hypothetical protein